MPEFKELVNIDEDRQEELIPGIQEAGEDRL